MKRGGSKVFYNQEVIPVKYVFVDMKMNPESLFYQWSGFNVNNPNSNL